MKLNVQTSWFPWLVLAMVFLHSVIRFTLFLPSFGQSDVWLLFVIVVIILWIERFAVIASLKSNVIVRPFYGSFLFLVGFLMLFAGRVAPSESIEVLSFFFMAAGLVAAFAPYQFLSSVHFIAVAGSVVVVIGRIAPAMLSSELAVAIASASAKVISAIFLPVSAEGVILYFGPYSAEVTQACSGMNSIFSLTALSVLYLHESVKRKPWHIAILVICVIPVAILTNFMRVILVVLATWYVGDSFAQGIFHESAGVFAFLLALFLLSLIDRLLSYIYVNATDKI